MIAAAYGGEYAKRLEFLAPEPVPEGWSQADVNTMRAFGVSLPPRG